MNFGTRFNSGKLEW